MVRKLLLGGALAWAAVALLSEARSALATYDARQIPGDPFLRWRFGTLAVERLARAVTAARPLVPPGSVVAFASAEASPEVDFYRLRWTAYLLPELDVGPLSDPAVRERARYLLTYRRQIDHPRLEPLRPLPAGGELYRVLSAKP